MSTRRDHRQKRAQLQNLGLVMLIVGIPILAFGLYSFGRNFFTHDIDMGSAFIGVLAFGFGGMLISFAAKILFFGHAGSIARYAADELMPVARDVKNNLVSSRSCASCGGRNDNDAAFCDQCGKPLA
jgi:hypothetical protein